MWQRALSGSGGGGGNLDVEYVTATKQGGSTSVTFNTTKGKIPKIIMVWYDNAWFYTNIKKPTEAVTSSDISDTTCYGWAENQTVGMSLTNNSVTIGPWKVSDADKVFSGYVFYD